MVLKFAIAGLVFIGTFRAKRITTLTQSYAF
jgi:hypothetical protein